MKIIMLVNKRRGKKKAKPKQLSSSTIEASTTWVHNVKFGHFYLKTL